MKTMTLREKQRISTREALVDAGVQAFARTGYTKCTIDEIARQAGASRATFYLHFKSKADLLPILIERSASHFADAYSGLVELAGALNEGMMTRWVLKNMDEWTLISDYMRPVYEATDSDPDLMEELFPEPNTGVEHLARALKRLKLTSDMGDARVHAEILLSPMTFYLRKHIRGIQFNREAVAGALGRIWYLYLSDLSRKTSRG